MLLLLLATTAGAAPPADAVQTVAADLVDFGPDSVELDPEGCTLVLQEHSMRQDRHFVPLRRVTSSLFQDEGRYNLLLSCPQGELCIARLGLSWTTEIPHQFSPDADRALYTSVRLAATTHAEAQAAAKRLHDLVSLCNPIVKPTE